MVHKDNLKNMNVCLFLTSKAYYKMISSVEWKWQYNYDDSDKIREKIQFIKLIEEIVIKRFALALSQQC